MKHWPLLNKIEFRVGLLLFVALSWCAGLILTRVLRAASLEYAFLAWNLFLALMPLCFSTLLVFSHRVMEASRLRTACKAAWAALWFIFFPNAPYIITDLIHLRAIAGVPLWLDVLMVSSCAATGLALGYASLAQIHDSLVRSTNAFAGMAFLAAMFLLAGFGIYLGRFHRWNSTDIFLHPVSIILQMTDRLVDPFAHPRAWGVTIGFGGLIGFGYAAMLVLRGTRTEDQQ
jgi:uncharacterized membrane protein